MNVNRFMRSQQQQGKLQAALDAMLPPDYYDPPEPEPEDDADDD